MCERQAKNFLLPPVTAVQNSGSATGNPRNKCILKPGHSLMDWIRLANSGIDLSGTGGRIISVTKEELIKHNTRTDAWMAIRGDVYNVTRYMDFHPGGVEELMRGVGTDATKLFNEIHAWVNYTQLLSKCRIGPLKNVVELNPITEESSFQLDNKLFEPFVKAQKNIQETDITPRLDWIQKHNNITLYFYTKRFCNPGSLIQNISHRDNHIEIWVLVGLYAHKFDFKLHGRIKWPPGYIRIFSESGKIEINFEKHENQRELWSELGKYNTKKMLTANVETEKVLEFKLSLKKKFNNDSYVILLTNEDLLLNLPIGYHLTIDAFVNDIKANKSYTPVPKKYIENFMNGEMELKYQHFLIKEYPHNNSFTQQLCNSEKDTTFRFSLPKGNLKLGTLAAHNRFCFLAAGSGLTPFLALIDHMLNRCANRIEIIKLFYFNKTSTDIWCNEVLNKISSEDERFQVTNILSNAEESWIGQRGHVNSELLFPILNISSVYKISYVAVCGPSGFVRKVDEILKELKFPIENVFVF